MDKKNEPLKHTRAPQRKCINLNWIEVNHWKRLKKKMMEMEIEQIEIHDFESNETMKILKLIVFFSLFCLLLWIGFVWIGKLAPSTSTNCSILTSTTTASTISTSTSTSTTTIATTMTSTMETTTTTTTEQTMTAAATNESTTTDENYNPVPSATSSNWLWKIWNLFVVDEKKNKLLFPK